MKGAGRAERHRFAELPSCRVARSPGCETPGPERCRLRPRLRRVSPVNPIHRTGWKSNPGATFSINSNSFQSIIPIHFNQFQSIPIHSNSFQSISINSNSFQFIPIHFNQFLSISIHFNQFQFISINFYQFPIHLNQFQFTSIDSDRSHLSQWSRIGFGSGSVRIRTNRIEMNPIESFNRRSSCDAIAQSQSNTNKRNTTKFF